METFERLRSLFDSAPVNAFLGLQLLRVDDEGSEVRLPVRQDFKQEGGVVHGGLLTTLADTSGVYALLPGLPPEHTITGIEVKLNFLRPAFCDGEDLVGRAKIVRQGRKLGIVRIAVHQGERMIADGLFTYLVLPPK